MSWLKVINSEKQILTTKEVLDETLYSNDLGLAREYMKAHQLMHDITLKDLNNLKTLFPYYLTVFDTNTLLKEFVFSTAKKIQCVICKKDFISPYEVTKTECKNELYHPKNISSLKPEKHYACQHDGCFRKYNKTDTVSFCCHRSLSDCKGCCLGDGKHLIVLID